MRCDPFYFSESGMRCIATNTHENPVLFVPQRSQGCGSSRGTDQRVAASCRSRGEGCDARVRTVTLVIVRGIGSPRARDFTTLLIGEEPTRDLGRPYKVMKLAPRPW